MNASSKKTLAMGAAALFAGFVLYKVTKKPREVVTLAQLDPRWMGAPMFTTHDAKAFAVLLGANLAQPGFAGLLGAWLFVQFGAGRRVFIRRANDTSMCARIDDAPDDYAELVAAK